MSLWIIVDFSFHYIINLRDVISLKSLNAIERL